MQLRSPRPVYDRNFALDKAACHPDNSVARKGETPTVKGFDMCDDPNPPQLPGDDDDVKPSGPGPNVPPPEPPPPPS